MIVVRGQNGEILDREDITHPLTVKGVLAALEGLALRHQARGDLAGDRQQSLPLSATSTGAS